MDVLLKNATVIDALSQHHLRAKDIFISEGIIQKIADHISSEKNTTVVNADGAYVSIGWTDIFSDFSDAGFEHRETLETGAEAALHGGFTKVLVVPNTKPAIDNKSQAAYIAEKSKSLPIQIFPLGAISRNIDGQALAEMYDMRDAGAAAFSDGLHPVQSAGLFLKALQYVKAFNGILVQQPFDASIGTHGLINEGIISTRLGLQGLPAISEELMIMRDIELLRYTASRLHITGISSAKSVELIANAKKEGLDVTCSVTPYHLFFTDEDLQTYDTNLKTNPPLRTKNDREVLRRAVLDGTIDAVASHHFPLHYDDKTIEFEYAKNGMIGLQTAYALVQESLPNADAERISALFSTNPAKIFGIKNPKIEEGEKADLTVFHPKKNTVFTRDNNKSKSQNSPLFGKTLTGRVLATISKNHIFIHQQ